MKTLEKKSKTKNRIESFRFRCLCWRGRVKVLEAKLVLGDDIIVSLATEFIENPKADVSKQDCELNSFRHLAQTLKGEYPRLSVCLLADSLYANETVFEICRKNKWDYLIRYKEGSSPSIMEEYREIEAMGETEESILEKEEIYRRKPNLKQRLQIRWLSSMEIREDVAEEMTETGRKRWLIENEGFKIQKNHRYLITQIADILMQMYENGDKGIRELKYTIKKISKEGDGQKGTGG